MADGDRPGELRPLTVMFCDLVGSTAMSTRLDPEELRKIVRSYQTACSEIIEAYGGYIAQYLGDGILVYFGFPAAHEDDAQRALRSGLEIVRAIPSLTLDELSLDEPLAARVGIHTGTTVTGEMGAGSRRELLAMGETPNVAARLQGLAEPNTVVVSASTVALAGSTFLLEPMGEHALKGLDRPIDVFQVVNFEPLHAGQFRVASTRCVGRQAEIEAMLACLEKAERGVTTVMVRGQGGIGKSRLIEAFEDRLDPRLGSIMAGCDPFQSNTFLSLFQGLIGRMAGFGPGDDEVHRLDQLRSMVDRLGVTSPLHFPLLASLLGLPVESSSISRLSPEARKLSTFEAVEALVLAAAPGPSPLVLLLEDLHWADTPSLELCARISTGGSRAPILLVLSTRPELDMGWIDERALTIIEVTQLDSDRVDELVGELIEGRTLPDEVLDLIRSRSDGIPLFVEELTRAVLESGELTLVGNAYALAGSLEDLPIPTNLASSMMARLDRLGPAKEIAQTGAVIGREFSRDLIGAVSLLPAETLEADLETLERASILRPLRHGAWSGYQFTQALLQDAAYRSLLKAQRRRLHARVARRLEEGSERGTRPEVLGYHWEQAQRPDKSHGPLAEAAERAAHVYANDEALRFFERAHGQAVEVLRARDDLSGPMVETIGKLNERQGDILHLVRRLDDARVAFRRALAQMPEDIVDLARLFRKMGLVDQQRPDAAMRLFTLAEATLGQPDDPVPARWRREWLEVQLGRLWVHYWQGDADEMRTLVATIRPYVDEYMTSSQKAEFFNQMLLSNFRVESYTMSDETLDYARSYVAGAEATGNVAEIASALFTCGFALLFRGDLDEAERFMNRALEAARRSGNRTIEIRIVTYLSTVYRRQGAVQRAIATSRTSHALASEAGMAEYVGMARANMGWVAYAQGKREELREHAAAALDAFSSSEIAYPFHWTARLPLLALAVEHDDLSEAVRQARALTDPAQQRLPEPLWNSLLALARGGPDGSDAARDAVGSAVALGFVHTPADWPGGH